jgi:hypothetical protein
MYIWPICCNFSVCVYCLIPQHCDIFLIHWLGHMCVCVCTICLLFQCLELCILCNVNVVHELYRVWLSIRSSPKLSSSSSSSSLFKSLKEIRILDWRPSEPLLYLSKSKGHVMWLGDNLPEWKFQSYNSSRTIRHWYVQSFYVTWKGKFNNNGKCLKLCTLEHDLLPSLSLGSLSLVSVKNVWLTLTSQYISIISIGFSHTYFRDCQKWI